MANGDAEPDIFKRLLKKVDKIDDIAADVREMKHELSDIRVAHGARLDRIGAKLEEHDWRFDGLDETLAQATEFVLQLNQDVKLNSPEISALKGRLAS